LNGRSEVEIMADILRVCYNNPVKVSDIRFKANLSATIPYFLNVAVKGNLLKTVQFYNPRGKHKILGAKFNPCVHKGWVATPCGKCWLQYWVTQLDEMHKFSSAIYGEALSVKAAPLLLSVEK
jgi:hypothetical protein